MFHEYFAVGHTRDVQFSKPPQRTDIWNQKAFYLFTRRNKNLQGLRSPLFNFSSCHSLNRNPIRSQTIRRYPEKHRLKRGGVYERFNGIMLKEPDATFLLWGNTFVADWIPSRSWLGSLSSRHKLTGLCQCLPCEFPFPMFMWQTRSLYHTYLYFIN